MPVFVTQERRNRAEDLVRQPDGQFSSVPLGAIYEELEDDLRQYVFRTADGKAQLATYARYDFVGCDSDPQERGLMSTVWSDRPLDAAERERVVAALRAGHISPPEDTSQ